MVWRKGQAYLQDLRERVLSADGSSRAVAAADSQPETALIAAGNPSRVRFLTELTLDPPDATSDRAGVPVLDEDYLVLSTIHSAKGRNGSQSSC